MAEIIPPRRPRRSNRERLQSIDHGVNNTLDVAVNAVPEALLRVEKQLEMTRDVLSGERRSYAADRVKIDWLYGRNGNDGALSELDGKLEKVDRKQNWMIGVATGGWIVVAAVLHYLHSSPTK